MTTTEPHKSPSGDDTRKAFDGASKDPNADLHDENAEEFEKEERDILNKFGPLPDPDDQSEEAEKIRKRIQKARDDKWRADANDDEKEQAGFSNGEKADFTADGAKYKGSKFRDYTMYGIADKGAYYKYAHSKQVSDKQLRRMIIRAHLDKGWTKMRFYKKGGTIDSQLTSRAQAMIATEFGNSKLASLRSIAENVSVLDTPTKEIEPWRALNPLAHLDKGIDNTKRAFSAASQQIRMDAKYGDKGVLAKLFPGTLVSNAHKPRASTQPH